MCGGNKGQSTQQTTQAQTYAPNPQAYGYLTNAMQQGQSAAQTPFQAQVAPVAGFSQDQTSAFNTVRGAQGMAQPYYDQAQDLFNRSTTPDVSQFFNPYAGAVAANMKDVFGQQMSDTTGRLTQAAGGVGADRIGVGQSELAKQQGLTAGQTFASLYAPSLTAAQQQQQVLQNAGYGKAALGQQAQNSVFSGAQQQLGVGGLQQQLSQAQMNAPYQWDLSRLAYPFQTAQFNAGITGALAPGFGGTTSGQGSQTNNPAQPSIWSQLLGGGMTAAGIYGGFGGFGGGTGDPNDPGWASKQLQQNAGSAAYGPGFASGGEVNPYAYAEGGPTVSDEPIDIGAHSLVPQSQLQPIRPNIPQLNLTPTQQQSGSSSGGMGDLLKTGADIAKVAMMFVNRGGRVYNPYDVGKPEGYATGGAPHYGDEGDPGGVVYRMPDRPDGRDPMDAWRRGVAEDMGAGQTATNSAAPSLPPEITGPAGGTEPAMAFSGSATPRARAAGAPGAPTSLAPPAAAEGVNPFSRDGAEAPSPVADFQKSPWAALTAAGLGMMAGTSPYAGVNIGTGGQQGMKMLEAQRTDAQKDTTIAQAARRLELEAKHHEDQYNRETVGQKQAREAADRPYKELTKFQKEQLESENWTPAGTVQTKDGLHPLFYDKKTLNIVDGITKKPPEPTDAVIMKGGSKNSPEEIANVVEGIKSGLQPPTLTGLYGDSVHVRSGLHAAGFDLAKAQVDWDRAKKATAAVNSSRMTQYVALNKSVDRTIDEVKELSQQMELGGVPFLNKLELAKYIQTQGNSEKGQLATRYMTAVNTLKEEFANLANGGYAPTEAAWKLANDQVNGNYGVKQLGASVNEIQRLIRYRLQAVPNLDTLGPGAANRYTRPAAASPSGGEKPDVTTRFNQLIGGGKSEEETYAILKDEGYK